jgi:glycine hydroxymethyltransferase
MGLDLEFAGGHLTHGSPANQSGKWFNVSYGVRPDDHLIDYRRGGEDRARSISRS